jgi:hypothetical protein
LTVLHLAAHLNALVLQVERIRAFPSVETLYPPGAVQPASRTAIAGVL